MKHDLQSAAVYPTDDVRIEKIDVLVPPQEVVFELPIPPTIAELVFRTRHEIHRILEGRDNRILMIVGPCSVHDYAAAIDYAQWLTHVREQFSERILILMRVYFEKPRTITGWKGLINDPHLDGSFRINEGLRLARRLLIEINGMNLPTASEFVDLLAPQYVGDLISWAAIGARTTESQVHRELASGLSCAVGFKNNTQGDVEVAVNAVLSARHPHHFLSVTKSGAAAIVSTSGNPDCHVVLRGGPVPNYEQAAVERAAMQLLSKGLHSRLMIDCSHGNCGGDFRRQLQVAQSVRFQLDNGSRHILGLMAESNLIEGKQEYVPGSPLVYGQSITDPCIGLQDTIRLLGMIAGSSRAKPARLTAVANG